MDWKTSTTTTTTATPVPQSYCDAMPCTCTETHMLVIRYRQYRFVMLYPLPFSVLPVPASSWLLAPGCSYEN